MATTVLRNITRDTALHERPRWAMTKREQARGLMFRRPTAEDCLIFPFLPARVARMHMWFVFGPIDIIALDGEGKVVAMKSPFRPWTFWSSGAVVSAVVELPLGTVARTGTRVGDRVALPQPPIRRSRA